MKLTLSTGGVPAGSYIAKFLGIEPTEANQYGPGYRWMFEVLTTSHAGAKISRITGVSPTLKNQCGKLLMGVSGTSTVGQEIDLAQFVGRKYLVVMVNRPDGGTSLDGVSNPPVG